MSSNCGELRYIEATRSGQSKIKDIKCTIISQQNSSIIIPLSFENSARKEILDVIFEVSSITNFIKKGCKYNMDMCVLSIQLHALTKSFEEATYLLN